MTLISIGAALPIAFALGDIDLSDFDTVLMDIMDQAVKDLEPHIGARNLAAATDDAQVLLADAARAVSRTCRDCHDRYRP